MIFKEVQKWKKFVDDLLNAAWDGYKDSAGEGEYGPQKVQYGYGGS